MDRPADDDAPSPTAATMEHHAWGGLILVAGLVVLAVTLLIFTRHRPLPRRAPASLAVETPSVLSDRRSVAVLPFDNFSDDKASGYFADGVQDEILTRLAKIRALRVISRTSTLHYAAAPADLPRIARELGVAHVLEGSVRRVGDTVRVNVQLIDAAADRPLWAETYDRKLTDLFTVQSEVASTVASQLQARLTAPEQQAIAQRPTENPAAYDAYLRGLVDARTTVNRTETDEAARRYLGEAVRLDPTFALAWARLALVNAWAYRIGTLPKTPALVEETRVAAETAYRLQPTLGEALLARGCFAYSCLNDYPAAEAFYQQARAVLPNDSQVSEYLGFLTRRRMDWDQSIRYFAEAVRLDPKNSSLLYQYALLFTSMRRWPEALDAYDQALANTSNDQPTIIGDKVVVYQARGELARAANLLAQLPESLGAYDRPEAWYDVMAVHRMQARLERRQDDALAYTRQMADHAETTDPVTHAVCLTDLGLAQREAGDPAGARSTWEEAKKLCQTLLVNEGTNQELIGNLGLTEAYLGNHEEGVKLGRRAVELAQAATDRLNEAAQTEVLAQIYTATGQRAEAVALLRHLLEVSYFSHGPHPPVTVAQLRLEPVYDPLRQDPEFRKLCGE